MHYTRFLTALMLPLCFGNTLAFSGNSDAASAVQAHLNLAGQSHAHSASDKVLNAVKAIIELYDSASHSLATEPSTHHNTSMRTDATSPLSDPDSDSVTITCKGPGYCCCPTGCASGCPRALLPAFPGLVQTLSSVNPDEVKITCKGPGYCCCPTGCASGCPSALTVLFPGLVQELTSDAAGKSEL